MMNAMTTGNGNGFGGAMATGACAFPREPYRPADLLPHQHAAIRESFRRAALRDGLDEDAAEEAASAAYARWLGRDYAKADIGRGDHLRAYSAIRKYSRLSCWKGFTGARRVRKAKVTEAQLAAKERLRQRNLPLPTDPVLGLERLQESPYLRRKAERLARRIGLTVETMVREACGFGVD